MHKGFPRTWAVWPGRWMVVGLVWVCVWSGAETWSAEGEAPAATAETSETSEITRQDPAEVVTVAGKGEPLASLEELWPVEVGTVHYFRYSDPVLASPPLGGGRAGGWAVVSKKEAEEGTLVELASRDLPGQVEAEFSARLSYLLADGLWLMEEEEWVADSHSDDDWVVRFKPGWPLVPADLRQGAEWQGTVETFLRDVQGGAVDEERWRERLRLRVVGLETVEVEGGAVHQSSRVWPVRVSGGTYEDCVRIDVEVWQVDESGQVITGESRLESRWFKPGVGLVKTEEEGSHGTMTTERVEVPDEKAEAPR